MNNMDIDGAIQAHSDWKLRLLNLARGTTSEKVDLEALRTDNHCALGRWLHGDGQKYAEDARFAKLLETHVGVSQMRGVRGCADRGRGRRRAQRLN